MHGIRGQLEKLQTKRTKKKKKLEAGTDATCQLSTATFPVEPSNCVEGSTSMLFNTATTKQEQEGRMRRATMRAKRNDFRESLLSIIETKTGAV